MSADCGAIGKTMNTQRSLLAHMLFAPLMKAAGITLLVAWVPLLLVGILGPEDANPIGLGLLALLATPVAIGLGVAGAIQGYGRWRG